MYQVDTFLLKTCSIVSSESFFTKIEKEKISNTPIYTSVFSSIDYPYVAPFVTYVYCQYTRRVFRAVLSGARVHWQRDRGMHTDSVCGKLPVFLYNIMLSIGGILCQHSSHSPDSQQNTTMEKYRSVALLYYFHMCTLVVHRYNYVVSLCV